MDRLEAEQPDDWIDPDRAAWHSRIGQGRPVDECPAQDDYGIIVVEAIERLLRCPGREPHGANLLGPTLHRRKSALFGRNRSEDCQRSVAPLPHRPSSPPSVRQAKLGLGQELQEFGYRPGQANFDHSPGHRADLVDGAEVVSQFTTLKPRHRLAQCGSCRLAGQRRPIGPGPVAQSEDIALAIVGDDPAVSQRGHYPALLVQADETFGRSGMDGLCRAALAVELDHGDCGLVVSRAAGKSQAQEECEAETHAGRLVAPAGQGKA